MYTWWHFKQFTTRVFGLETLLIIYRYLLIAAKIHALFNFFNFRLRTWLLTSAAELRNRIYDFCKEMDSDFEYMPPLLVKNMEPSPPTTNWSYRAFFALKQACQQIRTEFRPLWLRDSTIRITFAALNPFINTY